MMIELAKRPSLQSDVLALASIPGSPATSSIDLILYKPAAPEGVGVLADWVLIVIRSSDLDQKQTEHKKKAKGQTGQQLLRETKTLHPIS